MDEIINLRKKVDEVNRELFELLEKRFEITNEIACIKKKNNISLEDNKREEEMLSNMLDEFYHSKYKFAILEIYTKILSESKKQQKIEVEK